MKRLEMTINTSIVDEFFRPSYTSEIWVKVKITNKVTYQAMPGNNLSMPGVIAAQLDSKFDTVATSRLELPSTGEFGQQFGDFEGYHELAAYIGMLEQRMAFLTQITGQWYVVAIQGRRQEQYFPFEY